MNVSFLCFSNSLKSLNQLNNDNDNDEQSIQSTTKDFTLYFVDVKIDNIHNNNNEDDGSNNAYFQTRRFSDFVALNDALRRYFPTDKVPRLPPKTFLGSNTSEEFVRKRAFQLYEWSLQVLQRFFQFKLVQLFFHLDFTKNLKTMNDFQKHDDEVDDVDNNDNEEEKKNINILKSIELVEKIDEKFASLEEVFETRQQFLMEYYNYFDQIKFEKKEFKSKILKNENLIQMMLSERNLFSKIVGNIILCFLKNSNIFNFFFSLFKGSQKYHFLARTKVQSIAVEVEDKDLFPL